MALVIRVSKGGSFYIGEQKFNVLEHNAEGTKISTVLPHGYDLVLRKQDETEPGVSVSHALSSRPGKAAIAVKAPRSVPVGRKPPGVTSESRTAPSALDGLSGPLSGFSPFEPLKPSTQAPKAPESWEDEYEKFSNGH